MTTSSAPFGMRVDRKVGGSPYPIPLNEYRIASLTTATLRSGQPVALNANGAIDELTSAGITTGPTVGVFAGCQFTDPVTKYLMQLPYWPGGTSATDAVAFVVDDPFATFFIQANSSVAVTAVGMVAGITTASYTSGSTYGGVSYGMLNTSTLGTSNGLLRVMGIAKYPGNTAGDAFTVVEVAIANHQFNTTAGI